MMEIKKLSEVCSFQNGFAFKSSKFRDEGLPILRISNIQNNRISEKDLVYFIIEDYKENFDKYKVEKGDILIAMSGGTTGKLGVNYSETIYYLNQRVGKFSPKRNLDKQYLYYFLQTKSEESLKIAGGAAQPNLSTEQIKNFEIPIPPLSEQQAIVEKLDAAFALIDQAKANIEKNIQNAKELFQSKLNQIFSQKGEGWEEAEIGKVCSSIFAGGDAPKDNFSKNKTDKYNIAIYANAVGQNGLYGYTNVARVESPALTIAARGSGTGFSCLRYEQFFPIVRLLVLIPNEQIVLEFLKLAIDNQVVKSNGSAIPQLTVPMLKSYKISYPNSIETQQQIVSQLDALSEQTNLLQEKYQQKLHNLEELRKSVLEKAFKGELVQMSESQISSD